MTPYYQDDAAQITIWHGDMREVLPELGSFDLVLTDPPYGIKENCHRVASRGKLTRATDYGSFDWDNEPASKGEIDLMLRHSKNAIIWGGNYFQVPPARGWLVWDKLNGKNHFADGELAWTNLDQSVRIFRFLWNGMMRAGEGKKQKRVHPTQKPVELMTWCQIGRAHV